jgi:outer membrane protein TolC
MGKFKGVWTLIVSVLFSLSAFSSEVITLEKLREEVLNSNLDVQIQYENYYQAQKNISVAFGQFLPRIEVQLIAVNTTFAILQSVIPTPSGWFRYQESKELSVAEKFLTEAIKLNILEGLTINFINIKHQQALLVSMGTEEELLNQVYEDARYRESVGLGTPEETFAAQRALLQHRQQIFAMNSLIALETQAILIGLNRNPTQDIVFGDLPENDGSDVIPGDVSEATTLALDNAPELTANTFMREAAHYATQAARWSFISFYGIGFDYPATLAITKSEARVIELEREKTVLKISNQVDAAFSELDIIEQRASLQSAIVEASRKIVAEKTELYNAGQITFKELAVAKSELMSEERAQTTIEMERRVKIVKIIRLLGFDSSAISKDISEFNVIELNKEVYSTRRGQFATLTVNAPESILEQIIAVKFMVNGTEEFRAINFNNYFSYNFKLISAQTKVQAEVLLVTGDKLVLDIEINK